MDQVLIDPEKVDKVDYAVSLRGRDLRNAILNRSDLRKADLAGAKVAGASLVGANLKKARFGCFDEDRTDGCADIRGADFARSDLTGANFRVREALPRTSAMRSSAKPTFGARICAAPRFRMPTQKAQALWEQPLMVRSLLPTI